MQVPKQKKPHKCGFSQVRLLFFGSPAWARTTDPMINSHLLYQLSYRGSVEVPHFKDDP